MIDADALTLCSKKVAGKSGGDVRKAVELCWYAGSWSRESCCSICVS